MSVRAARLVCIGVGSEGGVRGGVKCDAKVHSATDIAENPLDGSPVNVSRSMHMEANLLNCVLKLRSSESEVLESTNNGPVEASIRSGSTISSRELGLRVDRSGGRFAVKHSSTVEELMSVLPLMKKETIRTTHHLNTEEVVQRTQVLDGKLSTETISKLAKELRSACCQDDVVNIEQQVRHVGALVINKQRSIGECGAEGDW